MSSLVPTAISAGAADAADVLHPHRLARAAHAGGKRAQVGARLLGERAEALAHRIGHVGERGRLERVRDLVAQARTSISRMPTPPRMTERTRPDARRQHGADARAQRIAHHVGAREVEMLDQRRDVLGHDSV